MPANQLHRHDQSLRDVLDRFYSIWQSRNMGLDINIVRLLLAARDRQVSFDRVLTVGRVRLHVYPRTMSRLLEEHNLPAAEFAEAGPAFFPANHKVMIYNPFSVLAKALREEFSA